MNGSGVFLYRKKPEAVKRESRRSRWLLYFLLIYLLLFNFLLLNFLLF